MAIVATAIDMDPTYLAYERPPDIASLWTAIPRGLRGFIVEFGAIDAKPQGDQQTLTLSGTLPANFAYVFSEIGLSMRQQFVTNWSDSYTLNLQNFFQGGFVGMSLTWDFAFANVGALADSIGSGQGSLDTVPRAPMWAPRGTSGIQIVISTFNQNASAATAGNLSAFINFWEFDLEQVRKYPINAPIPIHSR